MITGKVAKILNEFQLVLSAGTKQGVKKGMVFVVYEVGEEIKDPESGESLGKLEIVKGEVEIYHVQDSICMAQSKALEKKGKSSVLSATLAEVTPYSKSKLEQEREKLFVKQSDVSGIRSAGPIAVGDLARSVE